MKMYWKIKIVAQRYEATHPLMSHSMMLLPENPTPFFPVMQTDFPEMTEA